MGWVREESSRSDDAAARRSTSAAAAAAELLPVRCASPLLRFLLRERKSEKKATRPRERVPSTRRPADLSLTDKRADRFEIRGP